MPFKFSFWIILKGPESIKKDHLGYKVSNVFLSELFLTALLIKTALVKKLFLTIIFGVIMLRVSTKDYGVISNLGIIDFKRTLFESFDQWQYWLNKWLKVKTKFSNSWKTRVLWTWTSSTDSDTCGLRLSLNVLHIILRGHLPIWYVMQVDLVSMGMTRKESLNGTCSLISTFWISK